MPGSSEVVVTAVLAVFGGAGASLVAGFFARPKNTAETEQIQTAAEVAMSAEAREWAGEFRALMSASESRAARAEERAKQAEARAEAAEQHAENTDHRCGELEQGLVDCYGYVRKLRELVREVGKTPPALPVRLEALWRARGN